MRQPLIYGLLVLLSATSWADGHDNGSKAGAYEPQSWTAERSGTFNGQRLDYTVTAGETVLKNDDGEEQAAIFSIAYTKVDDAEPEERPLTFLWNGGPGSASVWLHMGAFGPKRVAIPSDARDDGAAPYPIVDNPDAILDVTDIVFVDPVGTGFSKAIGDTKKEDFYGVHQDAKAMARFIRQWISKHNRWNSPKFIGGESYGTLRSAAVIKELEGAFNDVSIQGILLISTVLDMNHDLTGEGAEMGYPILLPTMAATAYYHEALPHAPEDLAAFLQEARDFAEGPYMTALMKGTRLSDAEQEEVVDRLHYFTGLDMGYLRRANMRVSLWRFMRELLRDEGLTVGRLDSRYTMSSVDDAGENPESDPSFVAIDGAYTTALNAYLRGDIGVEMEREYSIIGGLGGQWDWDIDAGGRFLFNVQPYLGQAMRWNKDLRIYNAAGYYDFATPFFSAEFSLQRPGMDQDRIVYSYFEAGHMMYVHEPSLTRLNEEIRQFILDR